MSDLIDRKELRKAMYYEAFEKDSIEQKWDSGCWIRYKMFERILASIPSVQDVMPVKHAFWTTKRTFVHDGETYCSECEYETENRTTYCPNCGAIMEKKDEREDTAEES